MKSAETGLICPSSTEAKVFFERGSLNGARGAVVELNERFNAG